MIFAKFHLYALNQLPLSPEEKKACLILRLEADGHQGEADEIKYMSLSRFKTYITKANHKPILGHT